MQLSGEAKFVWTIPGAAIAIVALAFYMVNTKVMSVIAGILPSVLWLSAEHTVNLGRIYFRYWPIGAYMSLIVGALLILFGIGVIKSPSAVQIDEIP